MDCIVMKLFSKRNRKCNSLQARYLDHIDKFLSKCIWPGATFKLFIVNGSFEFKFK